MKLAKERTEISQSKISNLKEKWFMFVVFVNTLTQ